MGPKHVQRSAVTRANCTACGKALRPTHKFCPHCGAAIVLPAVPAVPTALAAAVSGGGASLQVRGVEPARLGEERRLVTVLFADLSGSTTLAERLDPEDMRNIQSSFFGALSREIRHFGGTIDKYIGDAVMAVFGAPIAHEDDPQRAIRAALAIQAALARQNDALQQQYGVRLALRIGVNTGEVVAGLLAGDVQSAYTVTGDTVNTAQRLESAAPPGEILAGELTCQLTRHAFAFEAVPPLTLKGKSEPVPAYRVLGRSDEALDRDAPPFVGREGEMLALHARMAEAVRGVPQVVHLYGEPGVGKSRLTYEFLTSLPETFAIIRARCVSHEAATPYALVADAVRSAFQMRVGESEGPTRTALTTGLQTLGMPAEDAVGILLEVLGFEAQSRLDPESKRRLLVSFLRHYIRARSVASPLVLLAEDIHWIDSASMSALKDAVDGLTDSATLFLSTSREAAAPWPATTLAVEPLGDAAASELVERTSAVQLEPKLRALLLERTAGNPFFIAEVVRSVGTQKTGTIPSSIHELLAGRLDALPTSPRRVAQRASVIGRTFSTRVLAQVDREDPLEAALATLETEAFIAPRGVIPEPTYAFRHALMQEVAYQSQLISQRRALHSQVGLAIEELYVERLDESVDVLAFHYDRSDNDAKALQWLVRAGDRAKALFANEEGLSSYEKALKRARDGDGPLDAGSILERIGDVQTIAGKLDGAIATFHAAPGRMTAPPAATMARLHRKVGIALRTKGAYPAALASFAEGRTALGTQEDVEAARIGLDVGQLHWRTGSYDQARESMLEAVAIGERLGVGDLTAEGLQHLGTISLLGAGDLKAAADYYQRSRAIYERLEDIAGIAAVRLYIGVMNRRMRRWDEALAEYEASLALFTRMGNPWKIAMNHNNIGELYRARGDPARGIPSYQRAIEIWEGIGAAAEAAGALMNLGAARVEMGDVAQGRADLLEAEKRHKTLGRTQFLPSLYRYLASAELAAGNLEGAQRAAARSLEFARAANAPHHEAMAKRVLGEIALARGERGAACELLEASRRSLAELGEADELARTEAVLRVASG